jgi:predicted molibdopterin-dependent oxidoreductase YjgC
VFNHAARVTTPLIKRAAQWQDASWEEALGVIAEKLRDVLQKEGPAAVGGLISPRATNEEIFLFQRFLREVVGTNHIDSTGRLCLEPYRAAMQEITGSDGLPVRLDAIAASDCIVIAGGDLDTDNHLIAANAVRTALWQNGARLIVLHPFKGRLAREADCWFPLLPGEEGIWVRGMIHHLLERHLEGPEAAQKIRGFAELKEAAKGFTLDRTAQEIGCTPELLQEAARHLAQARHPVFLGSPPLGQGPNGVDQIKALANLALLCNAFAAGGGLHCVHFVGPQSNMAGAEEMGASPFVLPGNLPPAEKGLSAVEQFQAAAAGRLKAMFVIGEDPFLTLPQGIVTQGVAQLELLAVQDLFLSETAHHAHVFLPALPWTTQNGTFTSYEGRVQRLRQAAAISTSDKSRQLGEVLTALAALLGKEFSALSPAAVFSEITQRHPLYAGLSFEPTTPQWRGAGQEAPMDKAAFSTFGAEPAKRQEGYPFALSLEGIFESHLIGETQEQRAQGLAQVSRSYLAINAEEAQAIGLVDTGRCRIITPWGETAAPVKTFPEQRRGSLVYVLSFSDPAASQLLGPELDPRSLAPAYAGIPARVEKA